MLGEVEIVARKFTGSFRVTSDGDIPFFCSARFLIRRFILDFVVGLP
jgi:hypothetical protein